MPIFPAKIHPRATTLPGPLGGNAMDAREDAAAQGITPNPQERAQRGQETWQQAQALAPQPNRPPAPNMGPDRQDNA
jgi:hypothetical protein